MFIKFLRQNLLFIEDYSEIPLNDLLTLFIFHFFMVLKGMREKISYFIVNTFSFTDIYYNNTEINFPRFVRSVYFCITLKKKDKPHIQN